MLYSLLPIVLLTAAAICLAGCLRKSFSDLLAPVIFSVIFVLYCFYIFDMLPLGRTVTTVLICCVILWGGIRMIRSPEVRENVLQTLKSRTFLLYLLAMATFLLFAAGRIVSLWDSLRLWGAYPKALHTTGALQLGEGSVLYANMQSYPPGMPLFCYYITSFSPVFPESSLYLCYSFFGFSMLLPLLDGAERLGKRALLAAFIGALFIPWMITSGDPSAAYYSYLFIDFPLGICAGYTFVLALRRFGTDILHTLSFCLAVACLALLKDSGSYIALCCIIGATAGRILQKNKKHPVREATQLLASALFLLFVWSSWSMLRAQVSATNHLQLELVIPTFGELARIAYRFLSRPATTMIFPFGAVMFSLPFVLLSIFILKFLLCRHWKRELLPLEIADIATQILYYGGFYLGYCMLFFDYIRNAAETPSYARYSGTLLASAVFIFAADCIFQHGQLLCRFFNRVQAISKQETPHGSFLRCSLLVGKIAVFASVAMFVAMTLFNQQNTATPFFINADETADAVSAAVPAFSEGDYTNVYLVIPDDSGSNSLLHQRIYFDLIDDGIRIKNGLDEWNITNPSLGIDKENLIDRMIQADCEYVALVHSNDILTEQFGEMFQEEGTNTVYKVDSSANRLIQIH